MALIVQCLRSVPTPPVSSENVALCVFYSAFLANPPPPQMQAPHTYAPGERQSFLDRQKHDGSLVALGNSLMRPQELPPTDREWSTAFHPHLCVVVKTLRTEPGIPICQPKPSHIRGPQRADWDGPARAARPVGSGHVRRATDAGNSTRCLHQRRSALRARGRMHTHDARPLGSRALRWIRTSLDIRLSHAVLHSNCCASVQADRTGPQEKRQEIKGQTDNTHTGRGSPEHQPPYKVGLDPYPQRTSERHQPNLHLCAAALPRQPHA